MLANTHLNGDRSAPYNFLTPEIRNLAKNLVYFGLYTRDLLGELQQTFPYFMCPHRGITSPHLILGAPVPQNYNYVLANARFCAF